MSEEEMKKAVFQKIDDLSPEQLKIVDEFIGRLQLDKKEEWDVTAHAKNIKNERGELLKKLAQ